MRTPAPTAAAALLAASALLAACGTAAHPSHAARTAAPAPTAAVKAADQAGPAPSSTPHRSASTTPRARRASSATAPARESSSGAAATGGGPSPAAKMICNTEIRASIATLLDLPSRPPPSSTWAAGRFTCAYRLPEGTLVMSVTQSPTRAAAQRHFQTLKTRVERASGLTGLSSLGLPAFESPIGMVAFRKDSFTLQVDATGMQSTLGPQHTDRTSFAYTLATDILGCWTDK